MKSLCFNINTIQLTTTRAFKATKTPAVYYIGKRFNHILSFSTSQHSVPDRRHLLLAISITVNRGVYRSHDSPRGVGVPQFCSAGIGVRVIPFVFHFLDSHFSGLVMGWLFAFSERSIILRLSHIHRMLVSVSGESGRMRHNSMYFRLGNSFLKYIGFFAERWKIRIKITISIPYVIESCCYKVPKLPHTNVNASGSLSLRRLLLVSYVHLDNIVKTIMFFNNN